MDKNSKTKDSIIEAAIYLFYMKGYSATSIRDIAGRAGSNSANISYHFQHKQGLLEHCFTDFFEGYLDGLERIAEQLPRVGAKECLLQYASFCLHYYRENFLLTRLVLREISVDTSLNREVYMTYLSKEKFLLKMILEEGRKRGDLRPISIPMFVTKLKAMLNEPFIHSQYFMEVWHIFPNEPYFTNAYFTEIETFLQECLFETVYRAPIELAKA